MAIRCIGCQSAPARDDNSIHCQPCHEHITSDQYQPDLELEPTTECDMCGEAGELVVVGNVHYCEECRS